MFTRTADPPGPSVGEELRETRRRGSPVGVGTAARSSHNNLAGASGALPGFLKRRSGYRGQQQRQHGSGTLPGMEARPSALRMALQSGGDGARRGSEASANTNDPHQQQQQQRRRGGSSGDESRRRDSTTTSAGSWEFSEPAQPRGSSPVSRPPSMRQRQGELNVSQSRGAGRASGDTSYEGQAFDSRGATAGRELAGGGRAAPHGHRNGGADASMSSFGRGGAAGGKGRAGAQARSSMRAAGGTVGSNNVAGAYRRTSLAESSGGGSSRRGSSSSFGGSNRGSTNNQAEDTMPPPGSTPRKLSSSSGRATSCPSGSPYQEAGFHQAEGSGGGLNSSRGSRRINRRGEHEERNADSAYSRRSSCDGVGSGKHRDGSAQHERGHGDGGGGAHARGSPATAPSGSMSTELDRRLPFIDGLDIAGPTENCPGGEQVASQGNSGGRFSSLAAAEQCLPGQGVDGEELPGQNGSSSNNSDDRREGGGKEHACVRVESSGGRRLDHTGYHSSGGLVAPGDGSSGGDVALQPRRTGTGGGGGSLRNIDQVAGRSANNGAADAGGGGKYSYKSGNARNNSIGGRSPSRECLVGLQNLGNTCFMNAGLQCLLHTDALVDLFRRRLHHEQQRLSSHNSKSPTRGALAEAFRELVALVEASSTHSNVSPAQVKRLIGKYAPHLSGYGQQDCQEFLRFFLDGLAEDLNRRDSGGHHRWAKRASHQQDEHGAGRGGGGGGGSDQQKRSAPPPPPVVPPMTDEEVSRLSAEQQADRAWALHLARNDSEITSMFCGQLQSRISCLSCGNVSFCFDPFFDLSVPLPTDSSRGRAGDEGGGYGGRDSRGSYSSGGGVGGGRSSMSGASRATTTLEDCLRAFSTEETLDGDNRPVCARCRRRRKSAKSLAVHRFPPILVIHLKRFQYNSTSRTKLSTAVDFPIGSGLDLLPYSTPAARPTSSGSDSSAGEEDDVDAGSRRWGNSRAGGASKGGSRAERSSGGTKNGSRSSPPLYELYAVCNHMGGLQGGHYTAHCRSGATDCRGRVSAGEWHTFDDTRVGPITTSRVGGASAYVLFYRLVTNNPESRQ